MIGILLALQVPLTPTCTSSALCRLLEAATAANQVATLAPGGYRAVAETEPARLGRWEVRITGATLLERPGRNPLPQCNFVAQVYGRHASSADLPEDLVIAERGGTQLLEQGVGRLLRSS